MNSIIRVFMCMVVVLASFSFMATNRANSQSLTAAQKAQLEQELVQVEAEQKQAEKELSVAQAQSSSLSRDISVLDAKIKAAQLDIKAKNLLIQTLGNDITVKENKIEDLDQHILKSKETLVMILQKTNEINQNSLPEIILSRSTISDFFQDIDAFDSLQESLQTIIEQLRDDQDTTTVEKDALDKRRNTEIDARYAIQQQQKNIEGNQKSKQQLLTISKNNEKAYNTVLAEKRARAAQIRAALFALRDAAPIPFEQALQYATLASQKTGVRPAYILAILTQESNLGSNVGQCYLSNPDTGDGVYVKTGNTVAKVMSPTRDVGPFKTILKALGGDIYKTVVSCPQSIGWGGAMGPAQFIPSTWLVVKDNLAKLLGISGMPDPWNPGHAFMAAALYLSDRGAIAGSYSAEKNAACKYYSGKSCGLVSGNTAYGNSVMALADNIQRNMIDPLQGL